MEMTNDTRTELPPRRICEVAQELGLDPETILPDGRAVGLS